MAKKTTKKKTQSRTTQAQRIARLEQELSALRAAMEAMRGGAPVSDENADPKPAAAASMGDSIAALKDTYNLLNAKRAAPTTTLTQERQILQEMGNLQTEILSQDLLRLHLKRVSTVVSPPGEEAGKSLANALATLEQMRVTTDRFILFVNLAAQIVTHAANHRREVDGRT